jgi:uncharacterized protein involved in exopolysaccharide biosynthesis
MDVRIDQVVLRALEKEPQRRYQTAGEFKQTVESIAGSAASGTGRPPVLARPAQGRGGLRAALVVAVCVWFFVTLCATIITFILPESYRATARIKIERDTWAETQNAPLSRSPYPSPAYDPYFIQTEFELLQSELILTPVIERLKLDELWSNRYTGGTKLTRAEARLLLRTHLDLRPVRNTSLIEISVWSDRADEAAEIANAIAEEFRAYRIKQHEALVRAGQQVLQANIAEQEARIAEAQALLDGLRTKLGITDEQARQAVDSVSAPPNQRLYWDERRKLEDLLRYRSVLSQKLLAQEQDSRMSGAGVEIVDRAVPPMRPARPNKPLNIVLGMVIGALLGLFAGAAAWIIARLRRRAAEAG